MPPQFAWPAAVGDLIIAAIAFLAIPVTSRDFHSARGLLWLFNVFGTLDLIAAITLASVYQAPVHMGAAYWIPAFWVPSLLVTHYLVFRILIQRRNERAPLREEGIKVADGGTLFALGDC
jgi:hypothetical protein